MRTQMDDGAQWVPIVIPPDDGLNDDDDYYDYYGIMIVSTIMNIFWIIIYIQCIGLNFLTCNILLFQNEISHHNRREQRFLDTSFVEKLILDPSFQLYLV